MGGNRTPIIDEEHLYNNEPSWVEEYHAKLTSGEITSEYKIVPSRLRRMTIDEAAIIQTFPTDYIFEGPQSRLFSQIGNAVPCDLAEAVFNAVKLALNGEVTKDASDQFDFEYKVAAA